MVSNLFFSVKITEAARRSSLALEFVKKPTAVLEKAKHRPTLMIILDLNFEAAEPLKLTGGLKGSAERKGEGPIGYLLQVQAGLGQAAQEAQEAGGDIGAVAQYDSRCSQPTL